MDTSDMKLFLPGITDDKTLEMASKVIGKVSYKQRGQEHTNEYDVIEPGMIRAMHDRLGLCIRGNRAPVLVHLPRIIRDPAYLLAKQASHDVALVADVALERAQQLLDAVPAPELVDASATVPGPAAPATNGSGNGHKLAYPWDGQLWVSRQSASWTAR
jgi:hypothetical protein